MTEVTRILAALDQGDPHAAGQLLPLVYDELRKLAAAKLAHEKPGHTLDATALVHEAFLRLASPGRESASPGRESGEVQFASKSHFLRAAAVAMRRILVDHARSKRAEKRGGRQQRVALEDWHRMTSDPHHLLALDEALERLAAAEPSKAELVILRFFGGLSMPEAADALGVSLPTVERWWAFARAWLYAELAEPPDENLENS